MLVAVTRPYKEIVTAHQPTKLPPTHHHWSHLFEFIVEAAEVPTCLIDVLEILRFVALLLLQNAIQRRLLR